MSKPTTDAADAAVALQDALALALSDSHFSSYLDELGVPDSICVTDALSFSDSEVLSSDKGVVVTMSDGSEYQLTIMRSR